jgi:hypothetical protein
MARLSYHHLPTASNPPGFPAVGQPSGIVFHNRGYALYFTTAAMPSKGEYGRAIADEAIPLAPKQAYSLQNRGPAVCP